MSTDTTIASILRPVCGTFGVAFWDPEIDESILINMLLLKTMTEGEVSSRSAGSEMSRIMA